MEAQFLVIFLNLGEGERDQNDDRDIDFEILLYVDGAIVAE